MIGYGISGGAFYLRAQAMAVYLANKAKPADVFIGTSAGALIGFVSAVLGVEKMWEFAAAINPKQALKRIPFAENGELKTISLVRAVLGFAPVQQSIAPLLNTLISNEQFEMWAANKSRINCFVTTCDLETGKRHIWNISKLDKEKALTVLEASARMQGLCDPVEIDGLMHWDGGQLDHNPAFILPQLGVSEVVAVWARPENWRVKPESFQCAGYFKKLMRMIEIDNCEKSLNDEQALLNACKSAGIADPYQVYIERVLKHQYDYSEESQRAAVQAAIDGVKRANLWNS